MNKGEYAVPRVFILLWEEACKKWFSLEIPLNTIREYLRLLYTIIYFAHNLILEHYIIVLFVYHEQLITIKLITLPIFVEMGIDSDIESKFLVDEISGPEIYDNSNDAAALTILRVIDNNIEQCIN